MKPENQAKLTQIAQRLSDTNLTAKEEAVKDIVENVKALGDKAVAAYSKKFDGVDFNLDLKDPFKVQATGSFLKLSQELQAALKQAKARIERFHNEEFKHSKFSEGWSYKGKVGERLGIRYQALDSVAIYIPAGQAPLLSTVLMTAIPAKVAGVKRIVMISPPPINPGILAAAELAGIDEIYAIGGAQAIAALAYGTQSIKAVDKIVGPGNIYVSLAKKLVFGQVGIDGIYGPSELAIIADDSAQPKQLAADLISQLEHGSGLESVLLVSTSKRIVEETETELNRQISDLAIKHKSAEQISTINSSLENWSALLHVESLEEAIEIINKYAPEHLEIQIQKDQLKSTLIQIKNAGAIFIGTNSCESLGDYIAGPSHCLPTGGTSRFSSGLQCIDFMKRTSIIDFSSVKQSKQGFQEIINNVATIARAEMLEGHARAMEERK